MPLLEWSLPNGIVGMVSCASLSLKDVSDALEKSTGGQQIEFYGANIQEIEPYRAYSFGMCGGGGSLDSQKRVGILYVKTANPRGSPLRLLAVVLGSDEQFIDVGVLNRGTAISRIVQAGLFRNSRPVAHAALNGALVHGVVEFVRCSAENANMDDDGEATQLYLDSTGEQYYSRYDDSTIDDAVDDIADVFDEAIRTIAFVVV